MTSREERRWRHAWDQHAGYYDRTMRIIERFLLRDCREWVCAQASGNVLEVAIGTGLNLPAYPGGLRLTGVEWSPAMLRLARRRAVALGREVTLVEGDARALPFADASFDTVVCTFSLCAIPDESRAVAEMTRVLRPGGILLLADHVTSTSPLVRAGQRLLERVTVPVSGERFVHRPLDDVLGAGCAVESSERFTLGMVERLAARTPVA